VKPSEAVPDVAYEIQCPVCQAGPQMPCVNVFTGSVLGTPQPHETRAWIARNRGVTA
jgi:hypothetical protein